MRDQVRRYRYYVITREQRWEKVFSGRRDSYDPESQHVMIEEEEEAFVNGVKTRWDEKTVVDGFVWFRSLGLRRELVERMLWEQKRGGFVRGNNKVQEMSNKAEELKEWTDFGVYVLVERFNFKRITDGSLALSYDFKHLHQMKIKWE